jgi:hypothetical protein
MREWRSAVVAAGSLAGTLTVISATQAVFTDKAGHRLVFTLVPSGGPGRITAYVCS